MNVMKKITFALMMLLLAFFVKAQSYDEIKQFVILQQYKKAKDDIDKRMTNAKFAAKPEAYILKASIYAGLAADSAILLTPEAATYRAESEAAFAKYQEMDPKLELVKDPVYQNAPIRIYSNLFSVGYKLYDEKKWAESFEAFKKLMAILPCLSELIYLKPHWIPML